jgi:hypothetical protein
MGQYSFVESLHYKPGYGGKYTSSEYDLEYLSKLR